MQVLLLKEVKQLGNAGDIKNVAEGYARNFLIPRGLAEPVTAGAVKQAERARQAAARRHEKVLTEAQALAQALDGQTITFKAHAGESDRLYGSITNANIAELLEEKMGREIDRRKIDLEEPIKELGTHAVTIRPGPGAEAKITVIIERED